MTEAEDTSDIAVLIAQWSAGDRKAMDQLLAHLYRDVHAIAVRQLRSERRLTIRPTALVHEVYLRLSNLQMGFRDRAHFLSMAARMTRQALVDEARRVRANKRDGGTPVTLNDENLGGRDAGYDALDVDALLTELQGFDEIAAEVVCMRVFGGLSIEETAEALTISISTVKRRWVTGKAWLTQQLVASP